MIWSQALFSVWQTTFALHQRVHMRPTREVLPYGIFRYLTITCGLNHFHCLPPTSLHFRIAWVSFLSSGQGEHPRTSRYRFGCRPNPCQQQTLVYFSSVSYERRNRRVRLGGFRQASLLSLLLVLHRQKNFPRSFFEKNCSFSVPSDPATAPPCDCGWICQTSETTLWSLLLVLRRQKNHPRSFFEKICSFSLSSDPATAPPCDCGWVRQASETTLSSRALIVYATTHCRCGASMCPRYLPSCHCYC
mmetsp:Transcript_15402/g.37924  ORF Transcript_15402/g.37924 Transcript_15402/m.37924 type:complete len:247 (-) Transcript_15402:155-895(-)